MKTKTVCEAWFIAFFIAGMMLIFCLFCFGCSQPPAPPALVATTATNAPVIITNMPMLALPKASLG